MDGRARNMMRMSFVVSRMAVLWTLRLIGSYLSLLFRRSSSSPSARLPPSTTDFRLLCIVTGASSGIGKATAKALALEGYHVILAGRSLERLSKAMSGIKAQHPGASLEIAEIDLSSVASILEFVAALKVRLEETHSSRTLQLLVNNAGILAATQRWTLDGYDCMIASNFLGPFMLTQLLLPILQKCVVPARVVNVVSFTHRCVHRLEVNESQLMTGDLQKPSVDSAWYPVAHIYETSKMCLLLFTYELHRRLNINKLLPQVTVMAADPGAVQTCILREFPNWLTRVSYIVLRGFGLLSSPVDGAKSVVDAALAPLELSGLYFFGGNSRTLQSSSLSLNEDLATSLWSCAYTLCEKAFEVQKLN